MLDTSKPSRATSSSTLGGDAWPGSRKPVGACSEMLTFVPHSSLRNFHWIGVARISQNQCRRPFARLPHPVQKRAVYVDVAKSVAADEDRIGLIHAPD